MGEGRGEGGWVFMLVPTRNVNQTDDGDKALTRLGVLGKQGK
jgi:hypothetical protein